MSWARKWCVETWSQRGPRFSRKCTPILPGHRRNPLQLRQHRDTLDTSSPSPKRSSSPSRCSVSSNKIHENQQPDHIVTFTFEKGNVGAFEMPLQPLPRYFPLPESVIEILVVRLLSSACITMSFSGISPQLSLNGMTNLIRSYFNLHVVVRQSPIASLSQGMPFIIDSTLFSLNVKKLIDRRWIVGGRGGAHSKRLKAAF